ncbi:hypothetical protein FQK07_05625 [Synechococcus sp. BSF8S]|nr:hypothetical protein [Synechococcus sp. BSF8S]MBC1263406.1 hypothetical protein [Synechococcus sp. BSA11S]
MLGATLALGGTAWLAPAAQANQASRSHVLTAIRQVWPAAHHESAIRLARLESGLSPTARGCAGACLGLFQIHYTAHRRLMATMGIHSPDQLLDPIVNSTVAYRLFRQSGWRPWGGQP